MAKRPNTLSVRWSRARQHGDTTIGHNLGGPIRLRGDLLYEWGDGCSKADGALMHYAFGVDHFTIDHTWAPSLMKELYERGYDLTTLKFSIRKRPKMEEGGP
jgi:hypothetical protein